jgi:hypothetical protein
MTYLIVFKDGGPRFQTVKDISHVEYGFGIITLYVIESDFCYQFGIDTIETITLTE